MRGGSVGPLAWMRGDLNISDVDIRVSSIATL
jgi:hypothetical protein